MREFNAVWNDFAAPSVAGWTPRPRDTRIVVPSLAELTLVRGFGGSRQRLLRPAAAAYARLLAAARRDGIRAPLLEIVSSYRTQQQQVSRYADAVSRYGEVEASRWVARPGHSVHQSGRAVDLYMGIRNASGNASRQRQTSAYRWLVANADRFDFVPYEREPWHWEFTPRARTGSALPASLPMAHGSSAANAGAPALLGEEAEPPRRTLYLRIPLGTFRAARSRGPVKQIPGLTGIYLPSALTPSQRVDVLLYLHGHHPRTPSQTIAEYWNQRRTRTWPLREELRASGKNVVLVAPTLGPWSEAGWLSNPGGLDRYLDAVLRALAAHGPFAGSQPGLGKLILACHSGGGLPMRRLAMTPGKYASRIAEVWGFDCLYNQGDETAWARWAQARPAARVYIHYLGSTAARSRKLAAQGVANVSVRCSDAPNHDLVPATHWRARLDSSPLRSAAGPGASPRFDAAAAFDAAPTL
jgi:hypothetical protein